eukprot:CAMPEP_0170588706 /NCGR_PEP_ID=MMETSP0224-20130122/10975_1 /TAXON_ID=285029 /ORGANISM="Togula jolla, Strain CCCM 725" /LENGTH=120 /DNA_ID=CAMNT_0010912445 /DNA_START=110 /DNA_END=470 /DNA_ORIENTATION=+
MSISSLTSLSSEGGGRREAAGADDQARQDARRSSSCNKVSSASDSDETSQDLWRGACSNKDSIAGAGDGRSGQPGRLVKSLLQQGQQATDSIGAPRGSRNAELPACFCEAAARTQSLRKS